MRCYVRLRLALSVVFAVVLGACGGSSVAQSAGPLEFLKRLDRSLCEVIANGNCKSKRKAGSATTARKAPAQKSKAKPETVEPQAVEVQKADTPLILKPRLRPGTLRAASAEPPPVAKTAASPTPLKPVLKPSPPVARVSPTKVAIVVPPRVLTEKPRLPDNAEIAADSCLAALKVAGARFTTAAQPVSAGACDVPVPVKVAGLSTDGRVVLLPDQPLLACAFALRLANWLDDLGQPLAQATAGSAISRLYTGPGFQCRGRNGDSSAKISEHGRGNAVDIERFRLVDGRELWVKDAANKMSGSYAALTALRQSACARFTTVLGPGSNSAHEEHFHFDLGQHGKSGTYVICQ